MEVFLVPLGSGRYELYCEPSDDDGAAAGDPAEGLGVFARMRRRFSEMLRAAEVARARRARGEHDPIDTWWERARARVLAKVADAVAEQRLLWHVRHCTAARLFHPPDVSGEQALAIMRASMVRDRDRHLRWLAIDAVLMLLSAALVIVPGPNVLGYYFAFRVVGHYLSWKGAKQALDGVTWTPASCEPLGELRDAIRMTPAQRDARVDAVAARLRLPRLSLFVARIAWSASAEPRPAGSA
jgi:hypothetical protein